ncbi:MAG: AzlC family ABC transporter permease [Clostridia bacterium]|nr:AzlC family ABC transporter permease [Clostridia bacterium]
MENCTGIAKPKGFMKGFKDGMPIALGYIPISIACAISAIKAGLSFGVSELLGAVLFTGTGQQAAINLLKGGETAIIMYAITLFVINCRYMLFAISIAQRFEKGMKLWQKILFGILNTDEIFGFAMKEKGTLNPSYLLGLGTSPYIGFFVGTTVGSLVTDLLPASISSALGIILFAMFIAIIVPAAKESKSARGVIFIALALSVVMECVPAIKVYLDASWIIIICAIATSLIGAWLFPIKEEGGK